MSLISWTPCHQVIAQAVCFVFCLNYNLLETHFLSMIYDSVKLKCETLVVCLYTIQNSGKSLFEQKLYLFDRNYRLARHKAII